MAFANEKNTAIFAPQLRNNKPFFKTAKTAGFILYFLSLPGYSAAGSAPRSGRGGRVFESPYPDYFFKPD